MMLNIKLKTKSGNDVKEKQTITVYFSLNWKNGLTKTTDYTYKIIYGKNKVLDTGKVNSLKFNKDIYKIESFTLRVILNMCFILKGFIQEYNLNPDYVLFISNELDIKKNHSWMYLGTIFARRDNTEIIKGKNIFEIDTVKVGYEAWDNNYCQKFNINKFELDCLKKFVDNRPTVKFKMIDPKRDKGKYAKSE